MKTRQELFDQVSAHLMTQKVPALDGGECHYRDPLGRKCAVGCLIEDVNYNSAFEGLLVSSENSPRSEGYRILNNALLASGVDIADPSVVTLLAELQHLHDNVDAESWSDELPVIAARLILTFTPDNLTN